MRSVTININQTCPLSCRHCSLGFSEGEHKKGDALSLNAVRKMVEAIDPRFYQIALFAGGEPTLNPDLILVGAEAAVARGLIPAVVTAPIWARTDHSAKRLISKLGQIKLVILSYDRFHLEFLNREHYLRAIDAIRSRGMTVVVQVTAATNDEADELIETMSPPLTPEQFNVMPVVSVGNASSSNSSKIMQPIREAADFDKVKRSCVLGNAFIDGDGGIHGCCWATSVPSSPISVKPGQESLAARFEKLENSRVFARMLGAGFIDSLSVGDKQRLFDLTQSKCVATECDLCLAAMREPSAAFWTEMKDNPEVVNGS